MYGICYQCVFTLCRLSYTLCPLTESIGDGTERGIVENDIDGKAIVCSTESSKSDDSGEPSQSGDSSENFPSGE